MADYKDCEYDAAKTTAAIPSGMEAGARQNQLTRMCMERRGYQYGLR